MVKMHTLAKVLITVIDIYWLVKAFSWLIQSSTYIFANAPAGQVEISAIIAALAIQLAIILLLIVILYQRDKIAEKIAAGKEKALPQSQPDWISFAYRLVSVIAGLYCFSMAVYSIGRLAGSIRFRMYRPLYDTSMLEQSISLFVLLAVGIYLFCGAPHFVKWQARKTIEMCGSGRKENPQ